MREGGLLCHDCLQPQRVLTFLCVVQPKRQLPLGNQTEAHADADQSERTQDVLYTMKAPSDLLATQLDVQASRFTQASEDTPSMASLSATNILAGSEDLSNKYVSRDEAEGSITCAGGSSAIDNQSQHTSCPEGDKQHV